MYEDDAGAGRVVEEDDVLAAVGAVEPALFEEEPAEGACHVLRGAVLLRDVFFAWVHGERDGMGGEADECWWDSRVDGLHFATAYANIYVCS